MRHAWPVTLLVAILLALSVGNVGAADPTPENQAKLAAVQSQFQKLPLLVRTKKFDEFAKIVAEIDEQLVDLRLAATSDPGLAEQLAVLEKRAEAMHRLMQTNMNAGTPAPGNAGAPPMPGNTPAPNTPAPNTPAPTTPATPTPPATPDTPTPPGQVSFVKDVAPLMVGRCGRCHINRSAGGLSLATYNDIIRGSQAGTIFEPGKGEGSTLIESLQSGDMPRGGRRLSDADIGKVIAWINQGAKFDGPNPAAQLSSLASATTPTPTPPPNRRNNQPQVARSTGNEQVSFMRDLAPIVVGTCGSCHSGNQPPEGLSTATFQQFRRGGNTADFIVAGNPQDSYLIKKLRGTAENGARMPLRRPALEEAVIKQFETWIAEGATFDGEDARSSLDFQLKVLQAQKMSHDELLAHRTELAKANWRLAMPGVSFNEADSKDFLILSNVAPERLDELNRLANAQRAKVGAVLKIPATPLTKGRLTIFAFDKRFEYSEFGRMVEQRELPRDLNGHFRYNVIDGYSALAVPSDSTSEDFSLFMAEQIAGAYLTQLSRGVPVWFAVGAGRMAAARTEPRSAMVKLWDNNIATAVSTAGTQPDFVKAGALDSVAADLSYGFAKSLMKTPARYQTLMTGLQSGTPFDAAFQKAYGGSVEDLAKAWLASGGK